MISKQTERSQDLPLVSQRKQEKMNKVPMILLVYQTAVWGEEIENEQENEITKIMMGFIINDVIMSLTLYSLMFFVFPWFS